MGDNANNEMQFPDGQPAMAQISAKEFASKFSTKIECYTFLAVDCNCYLPHRDNVTIYFVSMPIIPGTYHLFNSSRT